MHRVMSQACNVSSSAGMCVWHTALPGQLGIRFAIAGDGSGYRMRRCVATRLGVLQECEEWQECRKWLEWREWQEWRALGSLWRCISRSVLSRAGFAIVRMCRSPGRAIDRGHRPCAAVLDVPLCEVVIEAHISTSIGSRMCFVALCARVHDEGSTAELRGGAGVRGKGLCG